MTYEEMKKAYQKKEPIVFKTIASTIKTLMWKENYDFDIASYKDILLSYKKAQTKTELLCKKIYDAYIYLLSNRKNNFTKYILKRYYYLLTDKDLEEEKAIVYAYRFNAPGKEVPIDKIISMFCFSFEIFNKKEDFYERIIPYFMLNYFLTHYEIPPLNLLNNTIEVLDEIKKDYQTNKKQAVEKMIELIKKEKKYPKGYTSQLKELTYGQIASVLQKEEKRIKESFRIEKIYLYGSYNRLNKRLDSDIDLLVTYQKNINYEQKIEATSKFSEYFYLILGRNIDITEMSMFENEEEVEAFKNAKRIL